MKKSGYYEIQARCNFFLSQQSMACRDENTPQSDFSTIAIHNRKKWGNEDRDTSGNECSDTPQKTVPVNKKEESFELLEGIFPYFLQGSCTKRNCAVSHTTLQIGDAPDFTNDQNNHNIHGVRVIETTIVNHKKQGKIVYC